MKRQTEDFLVYSQNKDNLRFALYTLSIVEEMKDNLEAGKVSTKSILNLIKAGYYQRLKDKVISLRQQEEVAFSFEELGTFCILIDFSATSLLSSMFHPRLEQIYLENPFDSSIGFEQFSAFYLRYAAEFMDYLKLTYSANEDMITLFVSLSTWNRSDEKF
ncbi:hypothetical protein D3C87_362910 [compost metagenome]